MYLGVNNRSDLVVVPCQVNILGSPLSIIVRILFMVSTFESSVPFSTFLKHQSKDHRVAVDMTHGMSSIPAMSAGLQCCPGEPSCTRAQRNSPWRGIFKKSRPARLMGVNALEVVLDMSPS